MNNVAGVVAGVIAAACFATHATAQSSVPSASVERAYTPLDLDKCKHTKGREVEDYGSWRCTGYNGIPVRVSAGDQRTYISFGPNAAKEIAALNGRSVTFMAKYDFDDTGSSCHIHSSLWEQGADGAQHSAMYDHDAPHGMSDTFRWWLGGLIATAREFSLLWAPTINSYKRFQPGSWAPTGVGWGVDNRTLGFRKVGQGSGTRVECRIPGADANSYHAFAGTIAGGLYGIEHRIEPPAPYEGNGYAANDIDRVPWNLSDAIDLWEGSAAAREAFGDDVHHHILTAAKAEWIAFNQTVTDWELRRYFERI